MAESQFDNYEQILNEWLANFVDKNNEGFSLVFRNNAPTIEEIQDHIGDKVYCVYSLFEGNFGIQTGQPISLYSYGSQKKVFAKKEELSKALQNNAVVISGENIKVKFTSGSPFVQDKTDPDENVKGYYINIIATVYKV
jgi:hypothetical protein